MWIGESVFNFMKRARCCQWCVEMLLVWCEWSTQYSAAQDSTVQNSTDQMRSRQNRAEQNRQQEFRIEDSRTQQSTVSVLTQIHAQIQRRDEKQRSVQSIRMALSVQVRGEVSWIFDSTILLLPHCMPRRQSAILTAFSSDCSHGSYTQSTTQVAMLYLSITVTSQCFISQQLYLTARSTCLSDCTGQNTRVLY